MMRSASGWLLAAVIDLTLIQVVLRKDIAVAAGFSAEASLENGEKLNISAGLVDPRDRLQSYDGLFTDEYIR
jgi:hypothetical protein